MTNIITIRNTWKSVIADILILTALYFVPTVAHLTRIPLYMYEPMRVSLFVAILFTRSRYNAYFLAFTLPLFSYFAGGHPHILKCMLMCFELIINTALYWRLTKYKHTRNLAVPISIIISKIAYYIVKYAFLSFGLLNMSLITTPIITQLIIVFFITIIFVMVSRNKRIQS